MLLLLLSICYKYEYFVIHCMLSNSENSGQKYTCDEPMSICFKFKLIPNQVFLSIESWKKGKEIKLGCTSFHELQFRAHMHSISENWPQELRQLCLKRFWLFWRESVRLSFVKNITVNIFTILQVVLKSWSLV